MKKKILLGLVLLAMVSVSFVFAQALDGVWRSDSGNIIVAIRGSTGTYSQITSGNPKIAESRGYIKVGDQVFRNLRNTGALTWAGQGRTVTWTRTSDNVTGTSWANVTITMDVNQQNMTVAYSGVVTDTVTFTRANPTLNGVWKSDSGSIVVTISGATGTYTQINSGSPKEAESRGHIRIGDQVFRNLRSMGALTWSGQGRTVIWTRTPDNVTGTSWTNVSITMNENGRTIRITYSGTTADTVTYTRQ